MEKGWLTRLNNLTDNIGVVIDTPSSGAVYSEKASTPLKRLTWLQEVILNADIEQQTKDQLNAIILPGIQGNEDPAISFNKTLTSYFAWVSTFPDTEDEDDSNFLKDAAKVAGKIIAAPITIPVKLSVKGGKFVAGEVAKIPVLGKPLAAVVRLGQGPMELANTIARGENIKQSVVTNFKTAVADARTVGPYVQCVVSFVPGFGTAVSGIIGMGLAAGAVIAQGMPITEALKEGVVGALPGGAIVRLAANTAIAVAEGKNVVDAAVTGVSKTVGGIGGAAINVAYKGAKGGNIVAATVDEAIKQLPPEAQTAVDLTRRVARGENVSAAVIKAASDKLTPELKQVVKDIAGKIPVADIAKQLPPEVQTVLSYAKRVNDGEQIAPEILKAASDKLSPEMRDAVAIGLAMGTASGVQDQIRKGISAATPEDIKAVVTLGQQITRENTLYTYAATIVPSTQKRGYDLGVAVLSRAGSNEEFLSLYRSKLDPTEQKGFDYALAVTIGKVEIQLPPKHLEMQAQAAYFASKGVKRATIPIKTSVVEKLIDKPGYKIGLDYVVNQNKKWWHKVLVVLGYAK